MNEEKDTFAKRLRALREDKGLSQTAFGRLGGVSLRVQQRYESGDSVPDQRYFAALASNGYDILYLITGHRTPLKKSALSIEESDLIGNYRKAAFEGRKAIQATSAALAQPKITNKK